jgi:hypothetical protein
MHVLQECRVSTQRGNLGQMSRLSLHGYFAQAIRSPSSMNPWITGIIAGFNIANADQSKEACQFLKCNLEDFSLSTLIILTDSLVLSRGFKHLGVRKAYH